MQYANIDWLTHLFNMPFQALLANMAAMFALYHGPQGLRHIAERTHKATLILAEGLSSVTCSVIHKSEFVMNVTVTYQSCSCYRRTYQVWTQTPEWNLFWHSEDSLWCCCQRHTGEGYTAQDQSTNLWWRNGKSFKAMCLRSTFTELLWYSITCLIKGLFEHFKIFLFEWFQLGVSLDETITERDLDDLLWVFGCESSAVSTKRSLRWDTFYIYIYSIWQMPLSRLTCIYLIYTVKQLRALLKGRAVAAWIIPSDYYLCWFLFQELIAEKMSESPKGLLASPFKRTSKFLTHQVFNRSVMSSSA